MARPLRLEYEGAIYHVMARGNERGAIFRLNSDRLYKAPLVEGDDYLMRLSRYIHLNPVRIDAFEDRGIGNECPVARFDDDVNRPDTAEVVCDGIVIGSDRIISPKPP